MPHLGLALEKPMHLLRRACKLESPCRARRPPAFEKDASSLTTGTPAKTARKHLPVIVWIYGGGYINGSASMPLYRGDRLARKGVIVVTIAYRLGPLGFLALPELTRESPHHSSGNYGLMDQVAALEWVHRNIT